MKTTLNFIRHGQTIWNTKGILQGHLDSPLSKKGQQQAFDAKDRIKKLAPDRIITSDLGRAIETARILKGSLQIPVEKDSFLREQHNGILQGVKWNEALEKFPDVMIKKNGYSMDYCIPGGESKNMLLQRIYSGLEKIIKMYRGENILLVTHGGVIQALLMDILKLPYTEETAFLPENTSIHTIIEEDNKFTLKKMGAVSYPSKNNKSRKNNNYSSK